MEKSKVWFKFILLCLGYLIILPPFLLALYLNVVMIWSEIN